MLATSNSPAVPPASPLILLVEDHHDNRLVGVTILRHAGFHVLEAENGVEALHLAQTHRPALVLMDIRMPLLDGWSVIRALRDAPDTSTMEIVPLTAHALPGDRQRARELGCREFLTKPVEPLVMLETVRRLVPM